MPITIASNPGRDFEFTENIPAGSVRSKRQWVGSGKAMFMLSAAGNAGAEVPTNADDQLGTLEIRVTNTARSTPPTDVAAAPKKSTFQDNIEGAGEVMPEEKKAAPGEANTGGGDPAEITLDGAADKSKADSATSSAPLRFTISKMPGNAMPYPQSNLEDVPRSFVGRDRDGFSDVGPTGSFLVGVELVTSSASTARRSVRSSLPTNSLPTSKSGSSLPMRTTASRSNPYCCIRTRNATWHSLGSTPT